VAESPARARAIMLDPRDTVAVLIEDAGAGARIVLQGDGSAGGPADLIAAEAIPYGHKVAVRPMEAGDPVIKYGEKMGIARARIDVGRHVHVHNVRGLNTEERSVSARG